MSPLMNKNAARKPELLSPSGNMDCLKMAVAGGCDAVYFGGHAFNARAGAGNFSLDEIREAVRLTRKHGVKTFLTVNTVVKEKEFPEFIRTFDEMASTGITGVIVQDMGVASYIGENYPEIELHASTQMSIHSLEGVRFLEQRGFTRVVLARELSLEEVEEIRRQTGVQLEVFIHGALCYSVSGQCLLSSMIGGRSGNRGQCAQPCRLPYHFEGKAPAHLMNLKDMCSLALIPELKRIGVDSLKIEGRLKSPEYVYGVTKAYREALDHDLDSQELADSVRDLKQLFNRGGFSQGYWVKDRNMIESGSPKHQGLPIGRIESIRKDRIYIRASEPLHAGDVLEVRTEEAPYPSYQLQSRNLDPTDAARAWITSEKKVRTGQTVHRLQDALQLENLRQAQEPKIEAEASVILHRGEPLVMNVREPDGDIAAETKGPVVQKATGAGLSEETVRKQLMKTGGSSFAFSKLTIDMEEGCFLPVSQINEVRRQALADYEEQLTKRQTAHAVAYVKPEPKQARQTSAPMEIVLSTEEQFQAVLEEHPDADLYFRLETFSNEELDRLTAAAEESGYQAGICLSYYMRPSEKKRLDQLERKDLPVLAHNPGQLLYPNIGKSVLDLTVPVTNRKSQEVWTSLADEVTVSVELTEEEGRDLDPASTAVLAYGKLPVMITRQCLRREGLDCRKDVVRPALLTLFDRKEEPWTVETHCRECYNVLYTGSPVWMADRVYKLGGKTLRLQFLDEDGARTVQVIQQYKKALRGEKAEKPSFSFTRGRYDKPCL